MRQTELFELSTDANHHRVVEDLRFQVIGRTFGVFVDMERCWQLRLKSVMPVNLKLMKILVTMFLRKTTSFIDYFFNASIVFPGCSLEFVCLHRQRLLDTCRNLIFYL